jgi:hypothetical protein
VAEKVHDVEGGKQIETTYRAITRAHHCVSFSAARLSIGKTGCISTFESASNKGLDTFFVNLKMVRLGTHLLVSCVTVENIVQSKFMLFNVLGQVNFQSEIIVNRFITLAPQHATFGHLGF